MNKMHNENVNSVYSHSSHIYTKNRKFFRTKSYIVFIQIIYKYIYDFFYITYRSTTKNLRGTN